MENSTITRKCSRCLQARTLDCFHRNKNELLGRSYRCKPCTKISDSARFQSDAFKTYVERNRDRMRENDRRRNKTVKYRIRKEIDRRANMVETKARQDLRNSVAAGRIIRKPCEVCGNIKSQGHHEDYSKPFDVIWLCALHHRYLHMGKIDLPAPLSGKSIRFKPPSIRC